jgi:hypothetical protein
MERKSWLKIIGKLKKFVAEVGTIWDGTALSGYAEEGPYYCGNCHHLKGIHKEIFKDADGKGRCDQPAVISDSKVKKDEQGRPIVNIEKGCCAFVDPVKKIEEK